MSSSDNGPARAADNRADGEAGADVEMTALNKEDANNENKPVIVADLGVNGLQKAEIKTATSDSQRKFVVVCLVLQVVFAILFVAFVRYEDTANPAQIDNQKAGEKDVTKILDKVPAILDIHMMLLGGFGFLMTFLKRFGYSALGMTMIVVAIVTEWTILLFGFIEMAKENAEPIIKIDMLDVLDGGLCSAAVLISLGALLGKINMLQLLALAFIEAIFFVLNCHVGYKLLQVIDVGGAIFIHTFGAYFGLAVSLTLRKVAVSRSAEKIDSRYTSDHFAMVGTVLLWIFWPSFNACLANNDGYHRAIINTYISLLGSTVATFIVSGFFGQGHRLDMVHVQNATLSGGVAVGAIAALAIQPWAAFLAGSGTGAISALGYVWLQGKLEDVVGLHDTCGVNNLHGIPGIIGGVLSVIVCALPSASEETYGNSLYLNFPAAAPENATLLTEAMSDIGVVAGQGRAMSTQALLQLAQLGITLLLAIVTGAVTGLIINVPKLFHPTPDHELFNDAHYWRLPVENKKDEE